MESFDTHPEARPLLEQIFTARHWPIDLAPPTLTRDNEALDKSMPPWSVIERATKILALKAAPEVISGNLYGSELPLGETLDIQALDPGTILLYDLETLVPGPLALRDQFIEKSEETNRHYPGQLEHMLNLTPRELIVYRNRLGASSLLRPGSIYTSSEIGRDKFYYWRHAWMEFVAPYIDGNSRLHFLNIPLAHPEDISGRNMPKMRVISSCLPAASRLGMARQRHYFHEDYYHDFRDGVEKISSIELIQPKGGWDMALEEAKATQRRFDGARWLISQFI